MISRLIFCLSFVLGGSACSSIQSSPKLEDAKISTERALFLEEKERGSKISAEVPVSSDAKFNYMLGELSLAGGDLDSAEDYFEQAAELETKPAPALRRRVAQIHLQNGKIDLAREELERGLNDSSEDPDYLQTLAGVLANQGEYQRAVNLYERSIQIEPKRKEYNSILIANVYEQSGDLESARATLENLISSGSKTIFPIYYSARLNESLGRSAEAETLYKQALSFGQNSSAVAFDYARFLAVGKRFEEAQGVLEPLIRANPNNVKARKLMASILLRQEKVGEAIEEFEELSRAESNPTETKLRIAAIKIQSRQYESAIEDLNIILESDPKNSVALYYLGSAYAGLNLSAKAVEQLGKIGEGKQYYPESRTLAAFLSRGSGDLDSAIKFTEELIDSQGPTVRSLRLLTGLQSEAGEHRSALKSAESLIALEPNNASHHFTIATIHDRIGDTDSAVVALERSLEIRPRDPETLNYLAYTLAVQNVRLPQAKEMVERALSFEPKNGYYVDTLGWILYRQGDLQEAEVKLQRANLLAPHDSVIMEHLGIVLKELGRISESRKVFLDALKFVGESQDEEVEQRIQDELEALDKLAR